MKRTLPLPTATALICLPLILLASCGRGGVRYLDVRGDWLGQTPPGDEPRIFAPGIVSTGLTDRDVAMTPDGGEILWAVTMPGRAAAFIVHSLRVGEKWTRPEVVSFSGDPRYIDAEPHVAPDGTRLYFASNRPRPGRGEETGDYDIWVSERTGQGWGAPYNMGPPVNSDAGEYYPSLTRDGTIYFTRDNTQDRTNRIYRCRFVDGEYAGAELLPPEVNPGGAQYNAFINPDESYLIIPIAGLEDATGGMGGTDYYISFRSAEDEWTGPINMGARVNSAEGEEWSPYLSTDGRYFFFMTVRRTILEPVEGGVLRYTDLVRGNLEPGNGLSDMYWVDASFIEGLRPPR